MLKYLEMPIINIFKCYNILFVVVVIVIVVVIVVVADVDQRTTLPTILLYIVNSIFVSIN
jgi:hypothetical protein